jgi:hypothetical protein
MKVVEVIADSGSADTIAAIAEKHEAYGCSRAAAAEDGRQSTRILVADEKV